MATTRQRCELPPPDDGSVKILLEYLDTHGDPRLVGLPKLHRDTPGAQAGRPDQPPKHPSWCTNSLPDVIGYRILAMAGIQDPDDAVRFLRGAPPEPIDCVYRYYVSQDGAHQEAMTSDLPGLWSAWVDRFVADLVKAGCLNEANRLEKLSLDQRASCVLAAAAEKADRCFKRVGLIRDMLERCGVPTFGGYPTTFPHLHATGVVTPLSSCQTLRICSALTGERAVLALSMLAEYKPLTPTSGGGERRFASAMLLLWHDWRHQRIADLHAAGAVDQEEMLWGLDPEAFAACMLAALVQLGMACKGYPDAWHKVLAGWVPLAHDRLEGLLEQWRRSGCPAREIRPLGIRISSDDRRWAYASDVLATDCELSDCLHLMLFMFLLHAYLGLWQVPLDDPARHPERNEFYESLAAVLEYSCNEPELNETARRAQRALRLMPLMTGEKHTLLRALLKDIARFLPPHFNVYVGYVVPTVDDLVGQATNDTARCRIRLVYRLAEMVAEMLLDVLRLRVAPEHRTQESPASAAGFHWGNVAYAANRTRYRQQEGGRKEVAAWIKDRWRPDDDPSIERYEVIMACDRYRQATTRYYQYLVSREGNTRATATLEGARPRRDEPMPVPRLMERVQDTVPSEWRQAGPPCGAASLGCAICRVQPF